MPLFLETRNTDIRELMDDPDCDRSELYNTYRQFGVVNNLISRWKYIYNERIRPEIDRSRSGVSRLLDIGFGGGDIPLKIAEWAMKDGIDLEITAIDTDPRAFSFVQNREIPDNVTFLQASSTQLLRDKQTFDFVISNHLLHHLTKPEFLRITDEAEQLSEKGVYFNDIERSDIAYLLFNLIARPVFRSSFITHDGLASIKRSYTYRELKQLAPGGWQVQRLFPFRLILSYNHGRS